jgi:hypothetical protein
MDQEQHRIAEALAALRAEDPQVANDAEAALAALTLG